MMMSSTLKLYSAEPKDGIRLHGKPKKTMLTDSPSTRDATKKILPNVKDNKISWKERVDTS